MHALHSQIVYKLQGKTINFILCIPHKSESLCWLINILCIPELQRAELEYFLKGDF